jgi:hypothetical protein
MVTFISFIQHISASTARAIRQEQEINDIQIGIRGSYGILTDSMILYIANPQYVTKMI